MLGVVALIFVLALLGAQLHLLALIYAQLKDRIPAARPGRERERPRRDLIDEGVEGILTFDVKGKTGFEFRDEE